MATCASCGNDYDRCFLVTLADGREFMFDSVECAARVVAPPCVSCGVPVLGHGVQDETHVFCCAHCARMAGASGPVDRVATGS